MIKVMKPRRSKGEETKQMEGTAFKSLPVGLLVFDADTHLVNASHHIFNTFAQKVTDPEGRDFGEIFRCKHALAKGSVCGKMPACPACTLMENVKKVLASGESKTGVEVEMDFEINGRLTTKWFMANISSVTEEMQRFALTAMTDVTAKKQAEHELSLIGINDELTGLFTRRYVLKKLDDLIHFSWPEAFPISVALMGIDRYDEHTKDDMLKNMAETLKELSRDTDIVGRYGDDVLMAVFVNTDAEHAHDIVVNTMTAFGEKMRAKTGEPSTFSTGMISVGSVVGSICDIKDYIHDTEAMLEKAKQSGCGRVEEEKEMYL